MTMPEPQRGFRRTEYEKRLERAQRLMAHAEFDALLLCSEPEVRYFSGFLTQFWQSPTRPWFLVVPREGMPVAVIPEIGEPLMRRTWIDDIRTWPSPRPENEGVTLLADTLRELGAKAGRIGVPTGPETSLRMPVSVARPGASCSDLFNAMRSVIAADGYDTGNIGRMGHGLGMQLTEWPSHTPGDHTVLSPGMVLTLEPSLTLAPGRSMVHEENIVIREDGTYLLSRRAPVELPVV